MNQKVNTIFISPVTLMSYFNVALNKHNAGQGSVFCVWLFFMQGLNVSGCQKTFSETKCNLLTTCTIKCPKYLSTLTSP